MTTTVVAPLSGTVVALGEVDDPAFAGAFVGPGLAIDPGDVEAAVAVAPVRGRVWKLHPHAFVVVTPDGRGVLVHLGIDTVELGGDGFTLHAAEGDDVARGQQLVTWSPRDVVAGGRSAVCPVVVLDTPADALTLRAQAGDVVAGGEELFDVG